MVRNIYRQLLVLMVIRAQLGTVAAYTLRLGTRENVLQHIPHAIFLDIAGISLYRDCLYRNLYVMPIYDVQKRV